MPTALKPVKLTIRDVPGELNRRIVASSVVEGRSANKQVIKLIEEAFAARDQIKDLRVAAAMKGARAREALDA